MKTKLIIEFSDSRIKAVAAEFKSLLSPVEIKEVILEPVEAGFADAGRALKDIFSRLGKKKGLKVVVIISRNKVTVRKINLPSREPKEIEQMLSLHIIRQVPYPKEEIVFGYQNLGLDSSNNSRILTAIAHRGMLKSIFNAFNSLNILPEAMFLSSQGVIKYLRYSMGEHSLPLAPYLVLDIDYNYSDLMLVNRNQLDSTVVISQGAEQIKSDPELARFVSELKQALPAFQGDLASLQKPTCLFLSCALSREASNLTVAPRAGAWIETLEKELGLKIQLVKSGIPEGLDKTLKETSFAGLLGFAFSPDKKEDISFVLPEARIKKEMKLRLRQLLITGICVVYAFLISVMIFFSVLGQRQLYLARLKEQAGILKEKCAGLSDMEKKIKLVQRYTGNKNSALSYVYELTRVCPDNVTINSFSWEKERGFVIRGYTYQIPDVFSFVSALNETAVFESAQSRFTRRRKVKDKEIVDFEIGRKQ